MLRYISNTDRAKTCLHYRSLATATIPRPVQEEDKFKNPSSSPTSKDYAAGSPKTADYNSKKPEAVLREKDEFKIDAMTKKDKSDLKSSEPGMVDKAFSAMYDTKAKVKETLGFNAKDDRLTAEFWRGERSSLKSDSERVSDSEARRLGSTSTGRSESRKDSQDFNRDFGRQEVEMTKTMGKKEDSERTSEPTRGTSVSSSISNSFVDDTTRLDQVGREPWRNKETVEMQGIMKNTYDWKMDPKRRDAEKELERGSKKDDPKKEEDSASTPGGLNQSGSSNRASSIDKRTAQSYDSERSQYQPKAPSSEASRPTNLSSDGPQSRDFKSQQRNVTAREEGKRDKAGTREAETNSSAKVSSRDSKVPKEGMMGKKTSDGTDADETNIAAKDRRKTDQ